MSLLVASEVFTIAPFKLLISCCAQVTTFTLILKTIVLLFFMVCVALLFFVL